MAVNLICFRSHFSVKYRPAILLNSVKIKRNFSDDTKKANLYEILRVQQSATHREIKKAYYDLTLKYHPDRNDNSSDAALKFREVSEAYEILGNYGLRKKYDRGVPVTSIKKVAQNTVDHKTRYQEFFDSRSVKKSSEPNSRMEDIKELGSFKQNRGTSEDFEKPEESRKAVKAIIVIAFSCLIYFCRN